MDNTTSALVLGNMLTTDDMIKIGITGILAIVLLVEAIIIVKLKLKKWNLEIKISENELNNKKQNIVLIPKY